MKPKQSLSAHFFLLVMFSCCAFFFFSCSKLRTKAVPAPGQVFRDVQYGTAPDTANREQELTMDIYLPAAAASEKKYPLLMMIHGGGFNEGDKKELVSDCGILADSGYIGVSINYRLGWLAGIKKCSGDTLSQYYALYRAVQDANAALRFLVSKREEFHIDTSHIFIGGGSAGSTIAMYTQYLSATLAQQVFPAAYQRLGALNKSGNTLTDNFAIKGILNMWGGLGDSMLINRSNAIPMISFHGTADASSPYDIGHEFSCAAYPLALGSACLSRQLDHYNVPYVLHLKKDGAHAPAAYHAPVAIPQTIRFFNEIMKGTPPKSFVTME